MNTRIYHTIDNQAIAEVGALLRAGGLAAIPTETVYGLAANALDADAVGKIFAAKGRPQDNPLIVHISTMEEMYPLVTAVPEQARRLADAFWPGPLTMILPRSERVPDVVSAGLPTVAIRMPSHPVARAIIRAAGVPLAAPSANSSGLPSPTNAKHVIDDMDGKIDAIVDGGDCDVGVESTVITLASDPPRLLRPGGVTPEQLEQVLGNIEIDPAVTGRLAEGAAAASPGMKYKHYAPRAEVTIVQGPLPSFRCYTDHVRQAGDAALCFAGEEDYLRIPAYDYGREDAPETQAHKLFARLRQMDALQVRRVFVRCPSQSGVGLAVYNRLLRAASFRTVHMPEIYGLTGPTGAGKTTVAALLAQKGFHVVDCDRLARRVTEKGSPTLQTLAAAFGADILLPDGTLERKALARKAFASPENEQKLNAITHPAITALARQEILACREQTSRVLVDAALLFASELYDYCFKTIVVTADPDVRQKRIMERDHLTQDEAAARMRAQPDAADYERRGDIVIRNNGGEIDLADVL